MRNMWSSVSNALVWSRAVMAIRRGGCFWLKPVVVWVVRLSRAEVAEWYRF